MTVFCYVKTKVWKYFCSVYQEPSGFEKENYFCAIFFSGQFSKIVENFFKNQSYSIF